MLSKRFVHGGAGWNCTRYSTSSTACWLRQGSNEIVTLWIGFLDTKRRLTY